MACDGPRSRRLRDLQPGYARWRRLRAVDGVPPARARGVPDQLLVAREARRGDFAGRLGEARAHVRLPRSLYEAHRPRAARRRRGRRPRAGPRVTGGRRSPLLPLDGGSSLWTRRLQGASRMFFRRVILDARPGWSRSFSRITAGRAVHAVARI